ncbi:MAG TPA: 2-oxoglutarate dehydrogenase E1 component, partial [Xanthomonadaceae bacterium]|nr:2-oxoglutarate dehydrogenase E1 component [Xanthomonadaceae bacterium]
MASLLKTFAQSSQLSGGNAAFIEELYEQYLRDPGSVDAKWKAYFDGFGGNADVPHSDAMARVQVAGMLAAKGLGGGVDEETAKKQMAVSKLITAYRSRGHLGATLDPLGMAAKPEAPDLELEFHGLSKADLDTEYPINTYFGAPKLKVKDLLAKLRATYSGPIGAEFMHISDAKQRHWMQERLEKAAGTFSFSAEDKRRILERTTAAEGLERYLHTKYVGQKRFSLEGGDALIPAMDVLVRRAGANGVKDMVIGMAHRGRLNVLVNTLGKPPSKLFAEFEGRFEHHDDP